MGKGWYLWQTQTGKLYLLLLCPLLDLLVKISSVLCPSSSFFSSPCQPRCTRQMNWYRAPTSALWAATDRTPAPIAALLRQMAVGKMPPRRKTELEAAGASALSYRWSNHCVGGAKGGSLYRLAQSKNMQKYAKILFRMCQNYSIGIPNIPNTILNHQFMDQNERPACCWKSNEVFRYSIAMLAVATFMTRQDNTIWPFRIPRETGFQTSRQSWQHNKTTPQPQPPENKQHQCRRDN